MDRKDPRKPQQQTGGRQQQSPQQQNRQSKEMGAQPGMDRDSLHRQGRPDRDDRS